MLASLLKSKEAGACIALRNVFINQWLRANLKTVKYVVKDSGPNIRERVANFVQEIAQGNIEKRLPEKKAIHGKVVALIKPV